MVTTDPDEDDEESEPPASRELDALWTYVAGVLTMIEIVASSQGDEGLAAAARLLAALGQLAALADRR